MRRSGKVSAPRAIQHNNLVEENRHSQNEIDSVAKLGIRDQYKHILQIPAKSKVSFMAQKVAGGVLGLKSKKPKSAVSSQHGDETLDGSSLVSS